MRRLLLAVLLSAACVEGVECERKFIPKPSHTPPPPPDAAQDAAEDTAQDSAEDR